jgi:hypothetical protein
MASVVSWSISWTPTVLGSTTVRVRAVDDNATSQLRKR